MPAMVNSCERGLFTERGKFAIQDGDGTEPAVQRTGVAISPNEQPLVFGLEPVGLQTDGVSGQTPSMQLPVPGWEPLAQVLFGVIWPWAVAPDRSIALGLSYRLFFIPFSSPVVKIIINSRGFVNLPINPGFPI
jgi:hypothetical protein